MKNTLLVPFKIFIYSLLSDAMYIIFSFHDFSLFSEDPIELLKKLASKAILFLIPAMITGLCLVAFGFARRSGYRIIVFFLSFITLCTFFVFEEKLQSFIPKYQAETLPEPIVISEKIPFTASGSEYIVLRKNAATLSGIIEASYDFSGKPSLFFHNAATFSGNSIILNDPIPRAVKILETNDLKTWLGSAIFFTMLMEYFNQISSHLHSRYLEGFAFFLLHSAMLSLGFLSLWSIARMTKWPLFNVMILIAFLPLLLGFYGIITGPIAQPAIQSIAGTLVSTWIGPGSFALIGLIFVIFDFLFIPFVKPVKPGDKFKKPEKDDLID